MAIELEVGKRYVRRDGCITAPLRFETGKGDYPFFDNDYGRPYYKNGRYHKGEEHNLDLISEYIEEKDTVEIRKEFVKQAHSASCSEWKRKIEKEVPELFKREFVEEGWYIADCYGKSYLTYFKNPSKDLHAEYYFEKNNGFLTGGLFCGIERKATEEEVKSALVEEAKRRGFKKGVRFDCAGNQAKNCILNSEKWQYMEFANCLSTFGSQFIFNKGKWAEIIREEPQIEVTLEEIAKLKGVDVSRIRIKE